MLLSLFIGLVVLSGYYSAYYPQSKQWMDAVKALARPIMWPSLVLIFLLLRSLWVRVFPPEGSAVKREQAPQLFEAVNQLRRLLKGPSVHCLHITDKFNASISQRFH